MADAEGYKARRPGAGVVLRALLRDKTIFLAAAFLVLLILAAVFADFVAPYDPNLITLRNRNAPPMAPGSGIVPHLLGTDQLGRDILSRIVHGARVSLLVAFFGVLLSSVVGVLMGLIAGYMRGRLDDLIMRLVDLQMGFPFLLFAMFVLYAIGPGFMNLVVLLAIGRWPVYARVARGMALSIREAPYVEAARALGASPVRAMFAHVLPNMTSPLLVLGTLEIAKLILAESTLSFIGLGIQPPEVSWGVMIATGLDHFRSAWWLVTFPGIAILLTALSANLLAGWARAISDPIHRWRWLQTPHKGTALPAATAGHQAAR
jgi:peptide/nickel transport system permease protein